MVIWLDICGWTDKRIILKKEYQEAQIGKCDPWPLREMLETWSPTQRAIKCSAKILITHFVDWQWHFNLDNLLSLAYFRYTGCDVRIFLIIVWGIPSPDGRPVDRTNIRNIYGHLYTVRFNTMEVHGKWKRLHVAPPASWWDGKFPAVSWNYSMSQWFEAMWSILAVTPNIVIIVFPVTSKMVILLKKIVGLFLQRAAVCHNSPRNSRQCQGCWKVGKLWWIEPSS